MNWLITSAHATVLWPQDYRCPPPPPSATSSEIGFAFVLATILAFGFGLMVYHLVLLHYVQRRGRTL